MTTRALRSSQLEGRAAATVGVPTPRRCGFTLIEVLIAVAIIGIMAAVAAPHIGSMTEQQRVNRTALMVASDIRAAFTSAARGRVPVHVAFTFANRSYTITNRVTGDTIIQRDLSTGDLNVTGLSGSNATLDVFPSGIASSTDTITIGSATQYHKRVAVSRVGAVRVIP